MSRRLWIVPAVVLFLAISFELARYLSASGTERAAVVALLKVQASGDVPGMLARLDRCAEDPGCVAQVRRNAAHLRTAAAPKILILESGAAYTLTSRTGVTRVAWADVAHESGTFVQCIRVRKSWSIIHGATVHLERIGPRIADEASC